MYTVSWKDSLRNTKKRRILRKLRKTGKMHAVRVSSGPTLMLKQAESVRGWYCTDLFTSGYDARSSGDFILKNKVRKCTSSTASMKSFRSETGY
ncbi:hypothetical protein O3M35_011781 [Rhynocoris fuscipes]|uniref:Uncharacterized protein n=1 Tax=Rhynocoris fuscipes TaxID=488301 RepID=A0AAW1CZD4_9HEMI